MLRRLANKLQHNVELPMASTPGKLRLQYLSDVHVDTRSVNQLPRIQPISEYLLLAGDIGKPTHPHFKIFFQDLSKQFKKIFYVPGNHDFDCRSLYDQDKVAFYEPLIIDICKQFPNIHYLNRSTYALDSNCLIVGATLWSLPLIPNLEYSSYADKYLDHINKHSQDVMWMEQMLKQYSDKQIIALTHFVPTFQLIEPKYRQKGLESTSWYATNLEHLIQKPVSAWLCGHSHSILQTRINGVYCGINAYGYPNEANESNEETKENIEQAPQFMEI